MHARFVLKYIHFYRTAFKFVFFNMWYIYHERKH